VTFGDDSKPAQQHISFRHHDTKKEKKISSKHTKERFSVSDEEKIQ
jgi:hypothetical protein